MDLKGLKILIVDDEIDLCQVLSWDFEDCGALVHLAHSGNQAIEFLQQEEVDIILTDIKMPDGDGIELLDYTFKNKLPIKAIYLMTGYSDYPVDKLKEKGMKHLYRKPVDTESIIDDIKKL